MVVRNKVQCFIRDRGMLKPGDRIGAAVSGGADSVALLRVLHQLRAELGMVLSVAHFNHGLRGEAADADQAFVADLAQELGLELFVGHADVRDHAILSKQTIEAAARELRYAWFAQLCKSKGLNAIATGHTLDDQAETVLMKFLRGAGTRGLAGIYPRLPLAVESMSRSAGVVRPLLCVSRTEAEAYLCSLHQTWREDASNFDPQFTRNRIRHQLLPLLEREYNPNIRQVLGQTAEVARGEQEYWEAFVEQGFHRRVAKGERGPRLDLGGFDLPIAVQRRLLKTLLERAGIAPDFEHVENLERCARGETQRTDLSGGWLAVRRGNYLELQRPRNPASLERRDYVYTLPAPGEVRIAELGLTLRAAIVTEQVAIEAEPGTLLVLNRIGRDLTVRNWRPGDRYSPAHSRSGEKLKRLFSENKVPEAARATWPVVVKGDEIVWVRGFPVANAYAWRPGAGEAVRIEERQ